MCRKRGSDATQTAEKRRQEVLKVLMKRLKPETMAPMMAPVIGSLYFVFVIVGLLCLGLDIVGILYGSAYANVGMGIWWTFVCAVLAPVCMRFVMSGKRYAVIALLVILIGDIAYVILNCVAASADARLLLSNFGTITTCFTESAERLAARIFIDILKVILGSTLMAFDFVALAIIGLRFGSSIFCPCKSPPGLESGAQYAVDCANAKVDSATDVGVVDCTTNSNPANANADDGKDNGGDVLSGMKSDAQEALTEIAAKTLFYGLVGLMLCILLLLVIVLSLVSCFAGIAVGTTGDASQLLGIFGIVTGVAVVITQRRNKYAACIACQCIGICLTMATAAAAIFAMMNYLPAFERALATVNAAADFYCNTGATTVATTIMFSVGNVQLWTMVLSLICIIANCIVFALQICFVTVAVAQMKVYRRLVVIIPDGNPTAVWNDMRV